jgi:excisionase family DNA binding protein
MARLVALEKGHCEMEAGKSTLESLSLPALGGDHHFGHMPGGIEALLTSKEASQILKVHPKVLERMAKRGDVPAMKVGKFWRYRATTLDAWITSRLQSDRQPCRMKTSF